MYPGSHASGATGPLRVARSGPEEPAVIVGHVISRFVRGLAVGIVHRWFTSLLVVGLIAGTVYGLAAQGLIQVPGLTPVPDALGFVPTSTDVREMVVQEIRPLQSRSG